MEFLVLGLVAGIGFASYALWSQLRAERTEEGQLPQKEEQRALPPGDRTLTTIQVGDVVQHLGTDYLVEGVLTLSQEGRGVRLYRMVDGTCERYLHATPQVAEPLLLEKVTGEAPVGEPDSFSHAGQAYRLHSRMMAAAIGLGSFGDKRRREEVRLVEYQGASAARLVMLDWGDHIDLLVGSRILPHVIEILPGR